MSSSVTSSYVLSEFDQITPLSGGRNSQIYLADEDGQQVVIKFFSGEHAFQRFEREVASYQFLAQIPNRWTPTLMQSDSDRLYLKLAYISHEQDILRESGKIDEVLGQVFQFFEDALNKPVTLRLCTAADNALNFEHFMTDLKKRYEALKAVGDQRLAPILEWTQNQMGLLQALWVKQPVPKTLPLKFQRWIPADFSLHNILYQISQKRIYIVDFEYAGRDDPARLLADWVWHPGQALSNRQQQRIETFFEQFFIKDPSFKQRYALLKMGCGLRWLLILLNVFVPSYRQQRHWLSQQLESSWSELQAQQLKKAQQLKLKLENYANASTKASTSLGNGLK